METIETEKPDAINIPAYQRKRSLAAKARKRPAKSKIIKTRKTVGRPRKTTLKPRTILSNTLGNSLPSEQLFSKDSTEIREMRTCGECEGYFEKIDVAIIKLTCSIQVGDRIIFANNHGLFEQTLESMQINRQDVPIAHAGDDIGLKVVMEPTVGTTVYKVIQ